MKIEVFQICSQVWIECTIVGKIVQLLSNCNFKIKMTIGQSFLKLLLTNHYGFGMSFLAFPTVIMTSMCQIDCHLLLTYFKG
jgi:hypothetical protein